MEKSKNNKEQESEEMKKNEGTKGLVVSNSDLMDLLRPMFREGKTIRIRIKGMSMYPMLRNDRDVAAIRRTDHPAVGEVVLAEVQKGRYVLHRIISKDGDRLILMGDGNLIVREECLLSDVMGKVVQIIRNGHAIDPEKRQWRLYRWIWMRILPLKRVIFCISSFMRSK